MVEFHPLELHLHTLESLMADLVSGREILIGESETYSLSSDRVRSALNWYRTKGQVNWSSNVSSQSGEELVAAIQYDPPELPVGATGEASTAARRLTLVKMHAHRFAGIHKFGKPDEPPRDLTHDFSAGITLFEGRNGCGKTSILNAIVWALTGQILRPQRPPASADEEFECQHDPGADAEAMTFKISPVTPMPDASVYLPQGLLPIDTWVELTFADENGVILPPVRRSQSRSGAKLVETPPDFSPLGVDPVALRIGTVMPGLLPHIQVGGTASELSEAIAELTGLASLVTLAGHAKRARAKITGDYTKGKEDARDRADQGYLQSKNEIEAIIADNQRLTSPVPIPAPSGDPLIESSLDAIEAHFEAAKGKIFGSAQSILGETFDATDKAQRGELEQNCTLAIDRVNAIASLPSLQRLRGLRSVGDDLLAAAEAKLTEIVAEAKLLEQLAQEPGLAARQRLYARVAAWIAEHTDAEVSDEHCAVCGGELIHSVDPVTGRLTREHLSEAAANASLISQTLAQWAKAVEGELLTSLPPDLAAELGKTLPDHPCKLMRQGIIEELFDHQAFKGALLPLKQGLAAAFDKIASNAPPLLAQRTFDLPQNLDALQGKLERIDYAIRFARWRKSNDAFAAEISSIVKNPQAASDNPGEGALDSLNDKLTKLSEVVLDAKPVGDVQLKLTSIRQRLNERRAAEVRLNEYAVATEALQELTTLGDLAQRQVDDLQATLRDRTSEWRNCIYQSAFPASAHDLAATSLGPKRELNLSVLKDGLTAPAQHVVNASALRASLAGFYLAFWEHVISLRGGLNLILLDDPQDLLDDHNRESLASTIKQLVSTGAQPIVTSYNAVFADDVARQRGVSVNHYSIEPCTTARPCIAVSLSVSAIAKKRSKFEEDVNCANKARDYANECRIFFENKLGSIFDDPAHSGWNAENPHPTLAAYVQRVRTVTSQAGEGMFTGNAFKRFATHSTLSDNSAVLTLMNDSHHGQAVQIAANRVFAVRDELSSLLSLVDEMHEEAARWRRRELFGANDNTPPTLQPLTVAPTLTKSLLIHPDLAAFAGISGTGESQAQVEDLNPELFANKAYFLLRRPNFGFAAPQGAIAIIEAEAAPVANGRLVIARKEGQTLARRVLRSKDRDEIGLVAEIPDRPHRDSTIIFAHPTQFDLHQVVGIILEHGLSFSNGQDEAVVVDATEVLAQMETCFRVRDTSASPFAFENQVVVGGKLVPLDQLREDALVALSLNDGASVFKRVGRRLPGELSHIRQFESIGGLGSSEVLSVGKPHDGFRQVMSARTVMGVLYRA